MVMHVKEPLPPEYDLIRDGQIVFTYLHLAADETQTNALIKSRSVSIAYETIQKADGSLPLLTPMSEVAGRMAIQQGAKYLEMAQGGHGVLLGGVPGVDPGTVVVIGGGVVGVNAAKMACGLGAKVYLLDMNLDRLRYLSDVMPANCFTLMSSPATIRKLVREADVVVGAVLIPGAKAPRLVTRDMLGTMKKGSVLVDVAIDQGGCFETSKATTHGNPDLRGGRGGALLCGQHARRGGQDLDPGPDQRDAALCGPDRQQGLEKGHAGECRDKGGRQRDRRQGHLQGRGRGL
jgi:alanine dehydrogenase